MCFYKLIFNRKLLLLALIFIIQSINATAQPYRDPKLLGAEVFFDKGEVYLTIDSRTIKGEAKEQKSRYDKSIYKAYIFHLSDTDLYSMLITIVNERDKIVVMPPIGNYENRVSLLANSPDNSYIIVDIETCCDADAVTSFEIYNSSGKFIAEGSGKNFEWVSDNELRYSQKTQYIKDEAIIKAKCDASHDWATLEFFAKFKLDILTGKEEEIAGTEVTECYL